MNSTYKQALARAMLTLANDPKIVFIGYGVRYGGKVNGTLANIPDEQLLETPVAENLMVGLGIGLALKGFRPVVIIERCDFIMNAMDAIVNHLDKMATLSRDEFRPTLLLRVIVGGKLKPLFTGITHTQDYSQALARMVNFPVIHLTDSPEKKYAFAASELSRQSSMLVEYRDRYDDPMAEPDAK